MMITIHPKKKKKTFSQGHCSSKYQAIVIQLHIETDLVIYRHMKITCLIPTFLVYLNLSEQDITWKYAENLYMKLHYVFCVAYFFYFTLNLYIYTSPHFRRRIARSFKCEGCQADNFSSDCCDPPML